MPYETLSLEMLKGDMNRMDRMDIKQYKGVWIFAQQKNGKIMNITLELLGEGVKLAKELNVYLSAVLIGDGVKEQASLLFSYGADNVYLVEHKALKTYRTESYAHVICTLIQTYKPEIFLIGATSLGKDLGPRAAARLRTGLTADCVSFDIDKDTKELLQTKPILGGNRMAAVICPHTRPQMASVRPGVMKKPEPDPARKGKLIAIPYDEGIAVRTTVKETVRSVSMAVDLENAKIIVSGGRGLGGPEGFTLLKQAANTLSGAVGASRGAVDLGWISAGHQIGQTGKVVHPKLYIACGISGASQHLTGIRHSKTIIAINKNKNAPIMEIADYGIIGDYKVVLPLLTKEIVEAKK